MTDNEQPINIPKLLPGPGRPKNVKNGQGRKFKKSKGNGNNGTLPKIYEDEAERLLNRDSGHIKRRLLGQYKLAFLRHYVKTANITLSAREIGIARSTIFDWMKVDPTFKAAVDNGKEEGLDLLEEEIRRRGFDGYEQGRVTKDGSVVTVTQYSDNLAMFLAKGGRPEKFRDNYPVNLAPIQINVNLGTPGDVRVNVIECDGDALNAWQERKKTLAERQA